MGFLEAILSYFTRHRTAANLVLLIMILSGVITFPLMRTQFFPDVVFDSVSVAVRWEAAGAEDIDRAVVQLLIPALQDVEGVSGTRATSREGRANILLEFEPDWNMGRAMEDVKDAVNAVDGFPEDADAPEVIRRSWRDRVTDVVISGPVPVEHLSRLADELAYELFVRGVPRATIRGVEAPRTVVTVPESELVRHGITLSQIANSIGEEADADPSGEVGRNARVRTGVEKRSPEEVEGIAVRSFADGSKLLVGDVARVTVEGIDRGRAYFVGRNSAVSVSVERTGGGDAVELQRVVEEIADEMRLTVPQGVAIDLIRTRAEAITNRINLLFKNGALGLALVVGFLFLFLNSRTAFWVAAGVPTAMCAAICIMYLFGFTLNMISLFALIITLGLVVDDAIVVGEHADFRARRLGESPVEAAENSAMRMAAPVFAASITTIIAFFGITVVGGRFGSLLFELPATVIAVLAASLIECFVILPNHMKHALSHSSKEHWYDVPSRVVNKGFVWFRGRIFRPLTRYTISCRYPIIALAILILSWQVSWLVSGKVNWRFFNAPELGSVNGNFAMAPVARRADTLEMVEELQRATNEVGKNFEEQHGDNPVTFVIAEIGGSTGRGLSGADSKDRDLLGAIAIELIDADLRPYSSFEFVAELQEEVRRHPLLETLTFRGGRRGPGGDALDVKLFGADAEVLKAAAEQLKLEISAFSEVSAVEDDLAYDKEEFILELTAQGKALGFTIGGIARVLKDRLGGITAASFPVGTRSGAIVVQLPEEELTADFLNRTMMRSLENQYVPLADLVRIQRKASFSTVRRTNGVRIVSVTGDIAEDDPERAREIVETLDLSLLPALEQEFGISYRIGGLALQEQEFLDDARLGFGLVMIGIFVTLVWVLSSWTKPIAIMLTIPFGLIGAVYGHHLWGVPLSMFSVIGIIGMSGIIINDSIVLISTVNDYSRTRGITDAIVDAVCDRLRPVMLTTLTTILGLVPLLYETSQQASFLKPTVITLTYGLGFGFFLVLLLVPSFLMVREDITRFLVSFRRSLSWRNRRHLVGMAALGASATAAILFAGTLGLVVTGREFPLVRILPAEIAEHLAPNIIAFLAYVIGLALVCWLAYVAGVIALQRKWKS